MGCLGFFQFPDPAHAEGSGFCWWSGPLERQAGCWGWPHSTGAGVGKECSAPLAGRLKLSSSALNPGRHLHACCVRAVPNEPSEITSFRLKAAVTQKARALCKFHRRLLAGRAATRRFLVRQLPQAPVRTLALGDRQHLPPKACRKSRRHQTRARRAAAARAATSRQRVSATALH